VVVVSLAADDPGDRGIDPARCFAGGRCQRLSPIIKQLGSKENHEAARKVGRVVRCEFAAGQVRRHK
jgi:hypothetical protein